MNLSSSPKKRGNQSVSPSRDVRTHRATPSTSSVATSSGGTGVRTDVEKREREELLFKSEIQSFRERVYRDAVEGTGVKESLAEENMRIKVYIRKRPMNYRGNYFSVKG